MEVNAQIFHGDSRSMRDLEDNSIDLIVTSPPYWQIKDYGTDNQIGYQQTLHEYLYDLCRVWQECARTLKPGRRLCINIGDQFARTIIYGRYKIIPIHSEIIAQCELLGLDFLGSIIWQKKTTMNTTGGASIMGSFPHPPNGIVELDYEYILLFKKPGPAPKVSLEQKVSSTMTTEEWKLFFNGHWNFGGARQGQHEAMFPEELPRRLIRMFSFAGETILDPFMGSGTTAKVALDLERSAIGYEINPEYITLIRERLEVDTPRLMAPEVIFPTALACLPVTLKANYTPSVQDASPVRDVKQFKFEKDALYKVVEVVDAETLRLDTGLSVRLLGIEVPIKCMDKAQNYLKEYIQGKSVSLRFEGGCSDGEVILPAYVHLTNKIFVNKKMIEMGIAKADRQQQYKMREKFIATESHSGQLF